MIEKEIKILLSKEQYEKIEKVFSWKKKFTQINFYYGDLEKIDENGELTVRVRQNGDNYKLQIKKPVVYDEALHIKEEYERDSKRQTMRQSLKSTPPIIGDVASCIRSEDYLTMA